MTITPTSTLRHTLLKAEIVPVTRLAPEERSSMLELMQEYYEAVTAREFLSDLSKKDSVIILRDSSGAIRGFSTLVTIRVRLDGRPLRAVFSGDTVIDRRFWGGRALGNAFLHYLFAVKIKSPLEPLYWLLISKGYKTYLMMANNFSEHYPRFEKPTPAGAKAVLDLCYSKLYPETYDPQRGVIAAAGNACRLRPSVAGVTLALLKSNPRIAFFEECNPGWREGVELACIAKMTLLMPIRYALKVIIADRVMKPLARVSRHLFHSLLRPEQEAGQERDREL